MLVCCDLRFWFGIAPICIVITRLVFQSSLLSFVALMKLSFAIYLAFLEHPLLVVVMFDSEYWFLDVARCGAISVLISNPLVGYVVKFVLPSGVCSSIRFLAGGDMVSLDHVSRRYSVYRVVSVY